MPTLTVKTANGHINDLPDCELVAVDGVPFAGIKQTTVTELENRVVLLEQYLVGLLTWLDKKFPEDGPSLEPTLAGPQSPERT